jgi:hypothetical protein
MESKTCEEPRVPRIQPSHASLNCGNLNVLGVLNCAAEDVYIIKSNFSSLRLL